MKNILRPIVILIVIILAGVVAYYLYDNFRERTVTERLAEIIHLEDSRQLDDALRGYLTDDSLKVRQRAVLAVGRIGGPEASEILLNAMQDSALDVASTAAFAIGLTGEKGAAEAVLDLSLDMPSSVTAQAVKSAGRLADTGMVEVQDNLAGFLSHPSPDVREGAVYALFYCKAKSHADDILKLMSSETDSLVLQAGLYYLARLGISGAEPYFIEYLADPDPFLRSLSVRGLGDIKSAEAEHYLAIALNDSDPNVVYTAVSALRKQDDPEIAGKLLKKLRDAKEEKLRVLIISTLQKMKSAIARDYVLELLKVLPTDNIVAASVNYLAEVDDDRAVALIDSILNLPPSPYVRAACTRAYGLINQQGVISRLGVLFGDEDPMVRAAAFEVLTRLDSGNVDFYIKKALADQDYVLNTLAINLVGEKKLTSYLPTLKTIMSRERGVDMDVRRSIIQALEVFLRDDNDRTAREILIMGTLDKNYVVRREAVRIYQDVFGEDRWYMVPPAKTRISTGRIESGLEKYKVNPYAVLYTSRGEITMELYFDVAPLTVLNFITLAEQGFYDGLIFQRVIPNFVAQGGDPRGDGWGGPDYYIRDEYSDEPYLAGTVGIATSGKDTGGSQFFITFSPQPHLEARYTVFGQVLDGMDVVNSLNRGDAIDKIIIKEQAP